MVDNTCTRVGSTILLLAGWKGCSSTTQTLTNHQTHLRGCYLEIVAWCEENQYILPEKTQSRNMTEITRRRAVLVHDHEEGVDRPYWELTRGIRNDDGTYSTTEPLYKPRFLYEDIRNNDGTYSTTEPLYKPRFLYEEFAHGRLVEVPIANPAPHQFWKERKTLDDDAADSVHK